MTLTSEQAVAMNQRPRMSEAEVEQMISLRADGVSAAEIASQFPQYAAGTIFNNCPAGRARSMTCVVPGRFNCRTSQVPVRRLGSMTIGSCVRPRRC